MPRAVLKVVKEITSEDYQLRNLASACFYFEDRIKKILNSTRITTSQSFMTSDSDWRLVSSVLKNQGANFVDNCQRIVDYQEGKKVLCTPGGGIWFR